MKNIKLLEQANEWLNPNAITWDGTIAENVLPKRLEQEHEELWDKIYDFKDQEFNDAVERITELRKKSAQETLTQISLLGEIEVMERTGDTEYDGTHISMVIYLKDFGVYLKAEGQYYSYDGGEWKPWRTVEPYLEYVTKFK